MVKRRNQRNAHDFSIPEKISDSNATPGLYRLISSIFYRASVLWKAIDSGGDVKVIVSSHVVGEENTVMTMSAFLQSVADRARVDGNDMQLRINRMSEEERSRFFDERVRAR